MASVDAYDYSKARHLQVQCCSAAATCSSVQQCVELTVCHGNQNSQAMGLRFITWGGTAAQASAGDDLHAGWQVQRGDCVVAFSRREVHGLRHRIESLAGCSCCVVQLSLMHHVHQAACLHSRDPDLGMHKHAGASHGLIQLESSSS